MDIQHEGTKVANKDGGSEFRDARAAALEKGHFVKEDFYRLYRVHVKELEQFETDMASYVENNPGCGINPDCSLLRKQVEAVKPAGYDAWAALNPE